MKKIVIFGAGMSASTLIKYLLDHAESEDWTVRVGDLSLETATRKVNAHPRGEAFRFDLSDAEQLENEVKNADIVVSMLPAALHGSVARSCVKYAKNMVTASYVSDEMKSLHDEAVANNILILNEIGVDPGIDHMSAMAIIDQIHEKGGTTTSFRSYCGGLIAPKDDNNPWNYKFTWNPRNVVVAGQGGAAKYIENGSYKYVPYHKLFTQISRTEVLDYGEFEVYPNRDSLKYRGIYGLENIPTMLRGTMRRPGYSQAWNSFVQLGITDDTYAIENSENMTYAEFLESFVPSDASKNLEEKLANYLNISTNSNEMFRLRWLGLLKNTKIGLPNATPAQILQHLLVQKWNLDADDKDLLAMQHIFEYNLNGKSKKIVSSMVLGGQDSVHTAMSMTVGLPVAIAVRMILNGKITKKGVQIPTSKDIYEPVLQELRTFGIKFIEEEFEI